jgi:hypothetical protein
MRIWLIVGLFLVGLSLVPITTVVKIRWNRDEKGVFLESRFGLPFLGIEKAWLLKDSGANGIDVVEETELGRGKQVAENSGHKGLNELRANLR